MRKYLLPVIAIAVLASCSAPKYAYHFDHYDYNSGKNKSAVAATQTPAESQVIAEASPLAIQEETLVATADEKAVVVAEPSTALAAQKEAAMKKYGAMSKAERKAFRKEAKTQVKAYIKAVKSGDKEQVAKAAQRMDHDLKLAAIFGAVGIVSLLIGGDVFWVIGGIALIIGVVFFVMWLTRQ
jgi:ribosomal protein S20